MTFIILEPEKKKIDIRTIYCVGRNYAEHAHEMGSEVTEEPIVFIKPGTALIQPGNPIQLPAFSSEIHYETELVVLLNDVPKNVNPDEASKYILGYGIGLDLTARDIQTIAKQKGLPWTVAKGFDGSAPVSHFVKANSITINPETTIRLTINNVIKQEETLDKMIFLPEKIIAYLSKIFTLRRGDLIFTGTPKGVGPLSPGDDLLVELVEIVSFKTQVQAS